MAYPHLFLSKTIPTNPLAEADAIKEWYAFDNLLDKYGSYSCLIYLVSTYCNFSYNRSHVVTTKYLVFEIHYDGVFMKMPTLKYVNGKIMSLQVSKTNRMSFDNLLDILRDKLYQDI